VRFPKPNTDAGKTMGAEIAAAAFTVVFKAVRRVIFFIIK